jgi:phosphatidate phosphatase APP1
MGLFRGEITVSDDEVARVMAATGPRNEETSHDVWLPFQAALAEGDDRSITGRLRLIEPEGISIISDVDDTIKHSNVPNRRDLFRNTFTRTFVPVEGMPELYREFAEAGAVFHFVSGSPWQLYEPLSGFLKEEGYPPGSFHLKRFRIRDSARKLRRSPQKAYKQATIEPILAAFPRRRFVLRAGSRDLRQPVEKQFDSDPGRVHSRRARRVA